MNSETTIEQIHTSHVDIKKLNTMIPVKSPDYQIDWGPFPSPSPSPSQSQLLPSPSPTPVDFSPPLIAMVVIVAAAFFIVTYFRLISRHLLPPLILFHQRWCHRWNNHRRRRRTYPPSSTDIESPPHLSSSSSSAFHFLSPFGLDDEVIKTLPLSKYNRKSFHDCAVCLLEFEENDYVRTLPICSHSFHLDCIDIWLRSHANCPLCRARISLSQSPFIPLMAARIRPSLDDEVLHNILLQRTESNTPAPEIRPSVDEISSRTETEERFNFLLKRSYSFGFERNLPADWTVMEAATATPWRYRRGGSFWSKRPSPFTKQRVFSFRYMKSPFFRRRGRFFPVSESNIRFAGSSRRSKSMTSPMFMRSSVTATSMVFSSSRMRCGDLEALLSPERLNRR